MTTLGRRDTQTVTAGGRPAYAPAIQGVRLIDLGNVLTRSGVMTEVFRTDWPGCNITMQQLNWVTLNPQGVTDWHCHAKQTDHLVSVAGTIKLALMDGRPASPTYKQHDIIRFGVARPILVTVPPGVWHALRNESGSFAGYINVIEHLYAYDHPDNFRPERPDEFPDIL